MPGCYVPSCPMGKGDAIKNSTKTDDGRRPTLFSVPTDPVILEKWNRIIKRGDRPLNTKDKVCELHFQKDDLLFRKTKVVCEVGREHTGVAEKTIVKKNGPNVLPTILPTEYPSYLQPKIQKKRKKVSRQEYQIKKRRYVKKVRSTATEEDNVTDTPLDDDENNKNETETTDLVESNDLSANNYKDEYRCPEETNGGSDIDPEILLIVNEVENGDGYHHLNDSNVPSTNDINSCINAELKDLKSDKIKIGTDFISVLDTTPNDCLFNDIVNKTESVSLPNSQWGVVINENYIQFLKTNSNNWIDLSLKLNKDLSVDLRFKDTDIPKEIFDVGVVYNLSKLNFILRQLNNITWCAGDDVDGIHCPTCTFIIHKQNSRRCVNCTKMNIKKKKQVNRNLNNAIREKKLQNSRRRSYTYYKLQKQVKQQRLTIKDYKERMKKVKIEAVEEQIAKLPVVTQELVRTCIRSAQVEDKRNMRYSATWMYDCILLKIRSTSTYEYLRRNNWLPLPCSNSVRNNLKKFNAEYGFNKDVLRLMNEKAKFISDREKHGNIIIDEMQLTPSLHVNKSTLKITGFVNINDDDDIDNEDDDLGQNEKDIGDHGLVFLFQSYTGRWMQVVGSFLSKGCANGQELHRLVLECIFLLENAGYYVDGICTDGAPWNYNMFAKFGVGKGEGIKVTNSCEHPCDPDRRLYFFSDFCHLIKNLRNHFFKYRELNTPDGFVLKEHWDELLKYDCRLKGQCIKYAKKLTYAKLNLKGTQKMKVSWAFQIFSKSVSTSLTSLREQGHPELINSEPSSTFALRVNNFIDAMNNSHCSEMHNLRPFSNAETVIRDFLNYMERWRKMNNGKRPGYISKQTSKGFFITIKSTLDLMQYLTSTHNFQYILTRRLNSDSIEHFFSLVRNSGGQNDHPDSTKFIQIVSLLSLYSLIKPPKSANVTGEDILALITKGDHASSSNRSNKLNIESKLDAILDDETFYSYIPDILDENLEDISVQDTEDPEYDPVDEFATSYIAGYVARKASLRWCKDCPSCQSTIKSESATAHSRLIELRTKGSLCFPSEDLENLINNLENSIQLCIKQQCLNTDYILNILEAIKQNYKALYTVGCDEHKKDLTKSIIKFYVVTRLHFICANTLIGKNRNHQLHNKLAKF